MRGLNPMEIARFAILNPVRRRRSLAHFLHSDARYSYNPVRRCVEAIFDVHHGFLPPTERVSWRDIDQRLRQDCGRGEELQANRRVARGLYHYALHDVRSAYRRAFRPWPIGGTHVTLWEDVVLVLGNQPTIILLDPRASHPLGAGATTSCSR